MFFQGLWLSKEAGEVLQEGWFQARHPRSTTPPGTAALWPNGTLLETSCCMIKSLLKVAKEIHTLPDRWQCSEREGNHCGEWPRARLELKWEGKPSTPGCLPPFCCSQCCEPCHHACPVPAHPASVHPAIRLTSHSFLNLKAFIFPHFHLNLPAQEGFFFFFCKINYITWPSFCFLAIWKYHSEITITFSSFLESLTLWALLYLLPRGKLIMTRACSGYLGVEAIPYEQTSSCGPSCWRNSEVQEDLGMAKSWE